MNRKRFWLLIGMGSLSLNFFDVMASSESSDDELPVTSTPFKTRGISSGTIIPVMAKRVSNLQENINQKAQKIVQQQKKLTENADEINDLKTSVQEANKETQQERLAKEEAKLKQVAAEAEVKKQEMFSLIKTAITSDKDTYSLVEEAKNSILIDVTVKSENYQAAEITIQDKKYDAEKLLTFISRVQRGVDAAVAEVRAAILTHIMPISEEKYQGDVANYEQAHNYKPLFLTSQLYEVYHNTTSKTKWKQYNMLLRDLKTEAERDEEKDRVICQNFLVNY